MKKIVVAMSGGVDSSVAAALLQQQGYEVEGMFMKNWSPDTIQSLTDCPWEQDQADAAAVCEKLGIPFRSINFEKEYKERVVDYFLREYAAGRTPNPDVMCNKEIKFDAFLKAATEMGADHIATGHYARVEERDGRFRLLRGVDAKKDQSYFLYALNQEQLSRSVFPLGEMTKDKVRELAIQFDLPTAQKKDSQGICFIGHIDLKKFLMEEIAAKPGATYLLPEYDPAKTFEERLKASYWVGRHLGAMYYTVGERAGNIVDNGIYRRLRNGADVKPTYVVHKDGERGIIYVTDRHDDLDFGVYGVELEAFDGIVPEGKLTAQIRYQQRDMATVESIEGATIRFAKATPLMAVAEGQSLVLYKKDEVVGGGIVQRLIRN